MEIIKGKQWTNPRRNPAEMELTCSICGDVTIKVHCKIRCLNCGFMRDCSDP